MPWCFLSTLYFDSMAPKRWIASKPLYILSQRQNERLCQICRVTLQNIVPFLHYRPVSRSKHKHVFSSNVLFMLYYQVLDVS